MCFSTNGVHWIYVFSLRLDYWTKDFKGYAIKFPRVIQVRIEKLFKLAGFLSKVCSIQNALYYCTSIEHFESKMVSGEVRNQK